MLCALTNDLWLIKQKPYHVNTSNWITANLSLSTSLFKNRFFFSCCFLFILMAFWVFSVSRVWNERNNRWCWSPSFVVLIDLMVFYVYIYRLSVCYRCCCCICWVWDRWVTVCGASYFFCYVWHINDVTHNPLRMSFFLFFSLSLSPTVFVSIFIYRYCQKNNSEMSFTLIVKFVWQVFLSHSLFYN